MKMLWAFCDKVINKADAEKIKEVLTMTKIERLYEREKKEAMQLAAMG